MSNRPSIAPLRGLALCGGRATRLGHDKGTLDFHGRPQAQWLHELLQTVCTEAFVSIRADQAGAEAYRGLPAVIDRPDAGGPAAGLRAAWDRFPDSAWLVVAVDLPLVDRPLLATLLAARDSVCDATAFRHADGTPEPLCAIYEPRARVALEAEPRGSLRGVLETRRVCFAALAEPERLVSVNTAADAERLRGLLSARSEVRGTDPLQGSDGGR